MVPFLRLAAGLVGALFMLPVFVGARRDRDSPEELDIAAQHDDLREVKFLYDAGHNISRYAVLNACGNGALDVIDFFIEKAASFDGTPYHGTCLHFAAEHGQVEVIKLVLKRRVTPVDHPLSRYLNGTALYTASECGHLEAVRLLLAAGADPNAGNHAGHTPLHAALARGFFLIANELALVAANTHGWSPAHRAALQCSSAEIAANTTSLFGWSPLHVAVSVHATSFSASALSSCEIYITRLVQAGHNLSTASDTGKTPFSIAVAASHVSASSLLLRLNPSIVNDAFSRSSSTSYDRRDGPMHVAAGTGSVRIIQLLFDNGGNVHGLNARGETPLHMAADGHAAVAIALLCGLGANASSRSGVGATPMHAAVAFKDDGGWTTDFKRADTVSALAACGGNVSSTDDWGDTPLHLASRQFLFQTVRRLIGLGTDAHAATRTGETALHLAAACKYDSNRYRAEATVIALLDAGCDITAEDTAGDTPLHAAATNGCANILGALLDRDPRALHLPEDDLLLWAATCRDFDDNADGDIGGCSAAAVQLLLDRGANVNASYTGGLTPLHKAAASNNFDIVELLAASGAAINAEDARGWRPIHSIFEACASVSSASAHLEEVDDDDDDFCGACGDLGLKLRVFVALGANIDAPVGAASGGWSVLHQAAKCGSTAAIKVLFAAGASLSPPDAAGLTPLHSASRLGWADAVELLIALGAKVAPLSQDGVSSMLLAAAYGHSNVVEMLAEHGALVDALAWDGRYAGLDPMGAAAMNGHADVLKTLSERGAELNSVLANGLSPLHLAASSGHVDAAASLIALGASFSSTDDSGETPVHAAARHGSDEIIALLADSGANLNLRNARGSSPLHAAAENGHSDAVDVLLYLGAFAGGLDATGAAPLWVASNAGYLDVIWLLLDDPSVDVNASTSDGSTALHAAAEGGHLDAVQFLVKYNASTLAHDALGCTPEDRARKAGYVRVASYLHDLTAPALAERFNSSRPIVAKVRPVSAAPPETAAPAAAPLLWADPSQPGSTFPPALTSWLESVVRGTILASTEAVRRGTPLNDSLPAHVAAVAPGDVAKEKDLNLAPNYVDYKPVAIRELVQNWADEAVMQARLVVNSTGRPAIITLVYPALHDDDSAGYALTCTGPGGREVLLASLLTAPTGSSASGKKCMAFELVNYNSAMSLSAWRLGDSLKSTDAGLAGNFGDVSCETDKSESCWHHRGRALRGMGAIQFQPPGHPVSAGTHRCRA